MKMKEVCQKTGLTERAVRYYIERGLIEPVSNSSAIRSRTEYQFNNSHISQLRDIAILREYGFSIDRILEMEKDPAAIAGQLKAHAKETEKQESSISQRKEILSRICQMAVANMPQLAENLRREERTFLLPDMGTEVDFRRLDELEGMETGDGSTGTLERILHRESQKRKWFLMGIILLLLFALAIGLLVKKERNSFITTITATSFATFSEKWHEEGELFAALHLGEASGFAGISCTVRFEDYVLYEAIIPGYEYIGITINAEVPLRQGRKDGIIIEGAIPSVDMIRLLQDEALARKYAVVTMVQGE